MHVLYIHGCLAAELPAFFADSVISQTPDTETHYPATMSMAHALEKEVAVYAVLRV